MKLLGEQRFLHPLRASNSLLVLLFSLVFYMTLVLRSRGLQTRLMSWPKRA